MLPDDNKKFLYQNNERPLVFAGTKPASHKVQAEGKVCKHREENGWCKKGQHQCALLNLIFIKH